MTLKLQRKYSDACCMLVYYNGPGSLRENESNTVGDRKFGYAQHSMTIKLTLKAPITTAAYDIHRYFFTVFLRK